MTGPGEFYAPICAGPFRGIPAIHLVDTENKIDVQDIPKLVDYAVNKYGLSFTGKTFICLSRDVPPELVRAIRSWGAYVVGDVGAENNYDWLDECSHVMLGTGKHEVYGRFDSLVYMPDTDVHMQEPLIHLKARLLPKFLYVKAYNTNVKEFLANTQYPWSLQIVQQFPFMHTFDYGREGGL